MRIRRPAVAVTAALLAALGLLAAASPAAAAGSRVPRHAFHAPVPRDAGTHPDVTLADISCPSHGFCVAVGTYTVGSVQRALIEQYAHHGWSDSEAPIPADAVAKRSLSLGSVSCGAVGRCVAVGYYDAGGGLFDKPLVEVLSHGHWQVTPVRLPPDAKLDARRYLREVACPAADVCQAVGAYRDTAGHNHPLAETVRDGVAHPHRLPLPADASVHSTTNGLTAISCPGTHACVAVGGYQADHTAAFADTYRHHRWGARRIPTPGAAGHHAAAPTVVSCSSASFCAAIGTFEGGNDNRLGLLDTLRHGRWSARGAALPRHLDGQDSSLVSVACPAGGTCYAVGGYASGAGYHGAGLVEAYTHGRWHPHDAAVPADAREHHPSAELDSVSCATTRACTATGDYDAIRVRRQALVDTLSGGQWSGTRAALPRGARPRAQAGLGAVDCAHPTTCAAVGFFTDLPRNGQPGLLLSH